MTAGFHAARRPAQGEAALLRRVHGAFPDLHWSVSRYIDDGWDHEVVVLDERLVFRFPNHPYYDRMLAVEDRVLAHLADRVSAAVPRISHRAPDGSFTGYPLLGGWPLDGEGFGRLEPADRAAMASSLGDLISAVHALPAPLRALVPVGDRAGDAAEVEEVARDRLPGMLTRAEFAQVERILDETRALTEVPVPLVPLHADLYEDHLLWDADSRRLAVLDFSDMETGDPAVDFAEIGALGDEFRRAVLDAYRGDTDPGLLDRARAWERWASVFLLTDHVLVGKTSFAVARTMFDRVVTGRS